MKNNYKISDTPVKAGDLLLNENPFVYVLSSKEKGLRCDNCLQKSKVLKCSGCQFVHYCGRVCQKEAWSGHKWECSNLKRVAPKIIPDAARMLAKIVNRLSRGDGQSYRAYYTKTSFRMWKDLMSHYPDLKQDKKRMDHFTSLCMVLFEFLKDISLPNTVELMGMYGRMVINSFTILDIDMNSIGTGIYLASSIVDHSCDPNAVATFDGNIINIRAIQDMPNLDWNQIRISYIDLLKTPYERQTELLENYYFLCECDRCFGDIQIKILHAAKCPNQKCDNSVKISWKDCDLVRKPKDESKKNGYIKENGDSNNESEKEESECNNKSEIVREGECSACGTKCTDKQIEVFKKAMEFTEMHLQKMKSSSVAYVDVCKFCLEKQEGILHPLNVMHAQTMDHAFDALIQVQLWETACLYAEKLIPCFKFYYGERHPLLGLLHLKYGKILLYKMDLSKALEHLKLAEKILKITHGDRHPLYKEQLLPLLSQAMLES
ncbi:histone-lysine N-methyltransferase SMYD3 [Papilio machaon]|uniref:histone-lysine N-methyltransferase SMYD3 n=1 Tax=Papilio machaon TaxID=76193 RepID=UPI001E665A27|nr:histone-lysine N-methyltransferase SMYD3 [Papilio machaon]